MPEHKSEAAEKKHEPEPESLFDVHQQVREAEMAQKAAETAEAKANE